MTICNIWNIEQCWNLYRCSLIYKGIMSKYIHCRNKSCWTIAIELDRRVMQREIEVCHLLVHSKWPEQLRMGQAETQSSELYLRVSPGAGVQALVPSSVLMGMLADSCMASKVAGTWSSSPTWNASIASCTTYPKVVPDKPIINVKKRKSNQCKWGGQTDIVMQGIKPLFGIPIFHSEPLYHWWNIFRFVTIFHLPMSLIYSLKQS